MLVINQMLYVRAIVFTILVPAVVALYLPSIVDPQAQVRGGPCNGGWLLIGIGILLYVLSLLRFLAAGGTPAIFFTRHLRFLIGEEPARLVSAGLYRFSRNPMYVGVVMVVFGQAMLFASQALGEYGLTVFVIFHLVVVFLEEPHLRATRGDVYDRYCRTVPRWVGFPKKLGSQARYTSLL